jgi:hypothetical protein
MTEQTKHRVRLGKSRRSQKNLLAWTSKGRFLRKLISRFLRSRAHVRLTICLLQNPTTATLERDKSDLIIRGNQVTAAHMSDFDAFFQRKDRAAQRRSKRIDPVSLEQRVLFLLKSLGWGTC